MMQCKNKRASTKETHGETRNSWKSSGASVSGRYKDGGDGWGGGRRLVWGWGVLARTVYEWENGGRGTGNHVFGTRLSEIWESYELSPRLKFGRLVG